MTALIAQTTACAWWAGRSRCKRSASWRRSASPRPARPATAAGPPTRRWAPCTGAAVGGAVGGLAFGSAGGVIGGALVGALAGNLVGRALDQPGAGAACAGDAERLRGRDQRADDLHGRADHQVHQRRAAAARWSAARPVAPATTAAPTAAPAGRSSSPATKNGQTTTETTTFCKASGSADLKPVSV